MISANPGSCQWERPGAQGNWGFGMTLKSNGFGGLMEFGIPTKYPQLQKRMSLDFGTVKHQREIKVVNQGAQNPSPFVYGKLFHNFMLRGAFGFGKSVVPRSPSNHIGVELMALIGPTLVIQRPVYLDIMRFKINDSAPIINSEKYDPNQHTNQNNMVGYSRDKDGWDELAYRPGIGFKPAVKFYWGNYDRTMKQLQAGVMIDYFPGGFPIMAFGENPATYASPFLSFSWSFNK